jgi:DNA-binding GntR family transcriptional regulator
MTATIDRHEKAATLTDRVYRRLRDDILTGVLAPRQRLRIEALKDRYGVGATPLREALARLSGDGLVRSEERRGFTVASISREELWDLSETRALVECACLEASIRNAGGGPEGDAWEAQILAAYHRLSKLDRQLSGSRPTQTWEDVHANFHESLVAGCPLEKLKDLRRQLFDQSERYRRLSLTGPPAERDVPGEHAALMEAVLERDIELAKELLAAHIRKTAEICAVSDAVASQPDTA